MEKRMDIIKALDILQHHPELLGEENAEALLRTVIHNIKMESMDINES